MSVRAAALLLAAACGGAEAAGTPGHDLYQRGRGQDAVTVHLGDPPVPMSAAAYACARCHGAHGLGGSEGGVAAPALAGGGATTIERLRDALRDGVGHDGRRLLPAMPRYALSERDLQALAGYVARLPYAGQPGLDAGTLRIAIDLSAAPFAQDERARLHDLLRADIDRINGEGGLYGRSLAVAGDGDDAFFGLGWIVDPASTLPHLAVRAPAAPQDPTCTGCCVSLHPDLAAQLDWLRARLREEGRTVELQGPLAEAMGLATDVPPGRADTVIHIGPPAALPVPREGRTTYAFADLGMPAQPVDDLVLVAPVNLERQIAEVRSLQRASPSSWAAPHLATAAVELRKALQLLVDAMAASGRQVAAAEVCDRLRIEARARMQPSRMRIADGAIVPARTH